LRYLTSLFVCLHGVINRKLALCPTVRHGKLRPTPHCQTQQTSPHCQAQQTSPCAPLSSTADFATRPTVRQQISPHTQAQQTSPHAPLSAKNQPCATTVSTPVSGNFRGPCATRYTRFLFQNLQELIAIANRSRVSCTQYVDGIYDNPVTLKSRLRAVTHGHWKRNH